MSEFRPHVSVSALPRFAGAGAGTPRRLADAIPARLHSATVQRAQLLVVELPRLLLQHDRDAVADRIGEARGAADQLLAGLVVDERGLGARANQDLEQARIDPVPARRPWALGLVGSWPCARLPHCSVEPEPPAPAASSISASATSTSARALRSGASSSACFSSGP